ncbi:MULTISPECIES: hypothetical protein [Citrobacter]|uniref:hypothetical protein n=1 Tax=Citrobacter TaxID=544 RepID=UPI002575E7D8|nr:hypothetical protein [Citrobacter sp. Cf087]MDM3229179.1 hypothetical protein [Citrobacter sp. Cf087]
MSSREKFEAWVMTEVCISKSTLEGLRIDNGYRNSTLSGTDYNRMWSCWQAVESASEQKLTDMAVQLANAESKCRELAVENAGLKNPDNWLSQSDYGYEASEVATQNGATEDESLRAGMIAIINRIGTPATDAFLAEVRAQGVDMFALMFAEEAIKSNNITTGWRAKASRAASEYAEALREDAAQLRKGAAL